MKVLTTESQMRYTLESARQVLFEQLPPPYVFVPPADGPYIISITPQISSPNFEDPITIIVTGGRFTGTSDVQFVNEGSVDNFTVDSDTQITVNTYLYGREGDPVDNLFVVAADGVTTSPITPATDFWYAYAWPEDCVFGPLAITGNRIWSAAGSQWFFNDFSSPPSRFLTTSGFGDQWPGDAGWPSGVGDAGQILQDASYVYYLSSSNACLTRFPIGFAPPDGGNWATYDTLIIPQGCPPLGSSGSGSGGLGLVNSCLSGSKLYMVWGAQGKWNNVTTNYPQLVVVDLAAWSPTGFAIYPITTVTSPASLGIGVCVANGLILVGVQEGTPDGYAGKLYYSSVSTPGTFTKINLTYIPAFCVASGNFGYFMQYYFQPSYQYRGPGWQRHMIIADCTTGTPVISYVDMAADDANFKFLSQFNRDPIPWVSSTHLYVDGNTIINDVGSYSVPTPPFYLAKRLLGTGAADGGGSTPPPVADPNFSHVALLCGFNGKDRDQWILDEGPDTKGNAVFSFFAHQAYQFQAKISTAQKKFGASSIYFGGNSGIYWYQFADWDFGTSPFTVECWFYPTSSAGQQFLVGHCVRGAAGGSGVHGQWHFWIDASGHLGFRMYDWSNAVAHDIPSTTTPTLNTWHHGAVDFDGSNYRLYMDGLTIGVLPTSTYSTNLTANYGVYLSIGADTETNASYFSGYIDEVRISTNLARYANSTSYTLPTAAFPRGPTPLPANGIFMNNLSPWNWELWPFGSGAYSGGKLFIVMTSWDYGGGGSDGGLLAIVNEDLTSPALYPVPSASLSANDAFANAQTVTLGTTTTTGNLYYATGEANEQYPPVWDIGSDPNGNPSASLSLQAITGIEHTIWYKFTAPSTGDYTVTYHDRRGGWQFDLAVYSGSGFGSLVNIGQKFAGYESGTLTMPLTAGATYHLSFDRYFYYGLYGGYEPDLYNDGLVTFTVASATTPGTPPSFVNAGAQAVATGGMGAGCTVTPPLPTSRTNGNLLIAIARPFGTYSIPTSGGIGDWNQDTSSSSTGGHNYFAYGAVLFRWVDGTEVAPVFQLPNYSNRLDIVAQVFQYTGAAFFSRFSNPFGWAKVGGWFIPSGTVSSTGTVSAAPVTIPSPTLTYPYSRVLCVSMYDPGAAATPSVPPGFTSRNTTPATAATIFSETLTTDTAFAAGANCRIVIPPTYLSASGSNIRIWVQGPSAVSMGFNPMYVGHADQTVNPWNFDGTQVHAYFSYGNPNLNTVAAGTILKSDIIPYNLDHTKPLVISFYTTSTTIRTGPSPGGTTMTSYSKIALGTVEAANTVVTGYSGTTGVFLLVKIEVMDQHAPCNISDQSFSAMNTAIPATTLPETPDGWANFMLEIRSQ
jgi:hypothetical protein